MYAQQLFVSYSQISVEQNRFEQMENSIRFEHLTFCNLPTLLASALPMFCNKGSQLIIFGAASLHTKLILSSLGSWAYLWSGLCTYKIMSRESKFFPLTALSIYWNPSIVTIHKDVMNMLLLRHRKFLLIKTARNRFSSSSLKSCNGHGYDPRTAWQL